MSFVAALAISLTRAASVAVLAALVGGVLAEHLQFLRSGWRRLALVSGLVATGLTPALLTGYGYSHFTLSLVAHPWLNEGLYLLLMVLRLAPVVAAVLYFMPPAPATRAARFLGRLIGGRRVHGLMIRLLYGPLRNTVCAGAVAFLLAFEDFELASLMVRPGWTVWLFDAQVQGLELAVSLRHAAWAAACELAVIAAVGAILWRSRVYASPERVVPPWSGRRGLRAWALAAAGFVGVTALPLGIIGRGMVEGLATAIKEFSIGEEIRASLGFASAATLIAMIMAAVGLRVRRGLGIFVLLMVMLGLLGPLVLGLAVQAMFQTEALYRLYDSPAPLVIALTVFLTPLAVGLVAMMRRMARGSSMHVARMLQNGDGRQRRGWERLRWAMRGRVWVAIGAVLFILAYFELAASAILAPVGMASVSVRLYNLMHYSHPQVLSAMVVAAAAAPVGLLVVVSVVVRLSFAAERAWGRRSGD